MSSGINPIVLKRSDPLCTVETVRLNPEARKVVRRLCAKTALSVSDIVSSILIQAESLIDIEEADTDEDENED